MNQTWIVVVTNKRSYCARGDSRVLWMAGERVISMEVLER
jgi:hypothetical protein